MDFRCGTIHAPARAPHQDVRRCDVVQQHGAIARACGRHGDIQYAATRFESFQKSDVTKLSTKYSTELANVKQTPRGKKSSHLTL